jgi:hypothetical protein
MLAECEYCLENAALISLDHDLNPQPVKRSKSRVGRGVKHSFRRDPSLMKIHPNGSKY